MKPINILDVMGPGGEYPSADPDILVNNGLIIVCSVVLVLAILLIVYLNKKKKGADKK